MSKPEDFKIKDGKLTKYVGSDKEVVIPDGVRTIDNDAFYGLTSITKVLLPDGLVSIGRRAFMGCSSLTDINFPDSIYSIGRDAFCNCLFLNSALLPVNLSHIESNAFYNSGIREIYIGQKLSLIGVNSFKNCKNLNKITFLSQPELYYKDCINSISTVAQLGKVFDIKMLSSIYLKGNANLNDQIECMLTGYIKSHRKELVKSAIAEDNVTAISRLINDFRKPSIDEVDSFIDLCENNLIVKSWLIEYKKSNFSDETLEKHAEEKIDKQIGIKEYSIPELRKMFRTRKENDGLTITEIKVKDAVITIPKKIGNQKIIGIEGQKTQNNSTAVSVYFESDSVKIGDFAFSGFSSLENIIIPSNIKQIGNGAFYNCNKLSEIFIPGSVEKICANQLLSAFTGCKSLETVIFEGNTDSDFSCLFAVKPIHLRVKKDTMVYYFAESHNWSYELIEE